MTLRWMFATLAVVAIAAAALVAEISHPCSGDLTGVAPAIEHQHDLERATLSARAAAAMTEAVSSCETDVACVTRVTEQFTRFEADALGAKAREQRDVLTAECMRRQ
jgi:hypothetical protein